MEERIRGREREMERLICESAALRLPLSLSCYRLHSLQFSTSHPPSLSLLDSLLPYHLSTPSLPSHRPSASIFLRPSRCLSSSPSSPPSTTTSHYLLWLSGNILQHRSLAVACALQRHLHTCLCMSEGVCVIACLHMRIHVSFVRL